MGKGRRCRRSTDSPPRCLLGAQVSATQEEWTGFRSTCTMNRFRFAISGRNLVWGLQGKWEIFSKGVGGKSCAERQVPGHPSSASSTTSAGCGEMSQWSVSRGSAVAADCPYVLLANQLEGSKCWLKPPSWLWCGERSSNIRYIKAQD